MRDLFKTDFMYDVMIKPSKIEKCRGVRYNKMDYLFISAKLHTLGFLDGMLETRMLEAPYNTYNKTSCRKDAITKKLIIHNIFTGEEEIYLVDGTTDGFHYIT
jgi:hypothetical protein